MENSYYNTLVVRDSRIQDVSSKVDVVLNKGAATTNYQTFQANTQSTSSINFNVTLPSENVLLDREILMESELELTIQVPGGYYNVDGDSPFNYGMDNALNQFPLNSLFNTVQCSINNSVVSVNTQDIMGVLLRTYDDSDFSHYNTPHMSDKKLRSYAQMSLSQGNPLSNFSSSNDLIPRGSHSISYISVTRGDAVNNVVVTTSAAHSEAAINANLQCDGDNDTTWVIVVRVRVEEPLLFLSPFVFGRSKNNAGLYGVNNMNFTFNLDSSAKYAWSSGSEHAQHHIISLSNIRDSKLKFKFLTVQPSDQLSNLNVLPYVDYQRYITDNSQTVTPNMSLRITSDSLQLSQIPNRIFIAARKRHNQRTMADSNSFMAIEAVNINFNNVSGILSGASPSQLYNISRENGSKQDIYEFLGSANGSSSGASFVGISRYATTGSILVLSSKNLNLPDYLSNSSTGQYSLQFDVTVRNLDAANLSGFELVVVVENNGVFVTQNGQSKISTNLVTKEMVMNSTANQFGESSLYLTEQNHNSPPSFVKNMNLNNISKMSGSGMRANRSGGAFSGGGFQ